MNVSIHPSWQKVLQPDFDQPYFEQITNVVRQAYATSVVYPPAPLIFNAFNLTPFDQVKVVILGQDPYHGPGQAHGVVALDPGVEATVADDDPGEPHPPLPRARARLQRRAGRARRVPPLPQRGEPGQRQGLGVGAAAVGQARERTQLLRAFRLRLAGQGNLI